MNGFIPLIRDIPCGGELHRIGINRKGQLVFADHPTLATVKSEFICAILSDNAQGCGKFLYSFRSTDRTRFLCDIMQENSGASDRLKTFEAVVLFKRLVRFYNKTDEKTLFNHVIFLVDKLKRLSSEGNEEHKDPSVDPYKDLSKITSPKTLRSLTWRFLHGRYPDETISCPILGSDQQTLPSDRHLEHDTGQS